MAKTHNPEIYTELLTLFKNFLDQDTQTLERIKQFGRSFELEDNIWKFSLPDLHPFFCLQQGSSKNINYLIFRQTLYKNPTNSDIAKFGGAFDVAKNRNHIDKNIYKLSRKRAG